MRATIYVRQSFDRLGEALAVARQEERCRELCAQRGWDVAEVIVDNDKSATHGTRPGYQRLLAVMEAQQTDVVVVLRIDRLLRRLTELEALIAVSEASSVPVATVEGDLDLSTPSGRLVGRLLASVARAEIEVKSERQVLANRQKALRGLPHGSRRPFGYNADLMTLNEPEAAVLREMGRRVIAGHSYREIAWWANGQGYTTLEGRPWLGVNVRRVLNKERYGGVRTYDGALYAGQWEPVFDPETWQRLQLTMQLRMEAAADLPKARRYLLTGLLYCGRCGSPLSGRTKHDPRRNPNRPVYVCPSQGRTTRAGGCGGVSRNAEALDWWVAEAVLYRLDTPELAPLLGGNADDGQIRHLLDDRNDHRLRLDGLVDDYAIGLLDRSQFARAKAAAEGELQRVNDEIARLNRERRGGLVPVGQSVRQAWDAAESDSWRRELLRLVIKRIDVQPGITKPFLVVNGKRMRFDPSLIQITWQV